MFSDSICIRKYTDQINTSVLAHVTQLKYHRRYTQSFKSVACIDHVVIERTSVSLLHPCRTPKKSVLYMVNSKTQTSLPTNSD